MACICSILGALSDFISKIRKPNVVVRCLGRDENSKHFVLLLENIGDSTAKNVSLSVLSADCSFSIKLNDLDYEDDAECKKKTKMQVGVMSPGDKFRFEITCDTIVSKHLEMIAHMRVLNWIPWCKNLDVTLDPEILY